ncbi:MAG: oligosaccharide flippase family protein, partial [Oscillospiraceae bacterium]
MKKQGFIKGSAILMGMVIITKAIGIIYKLFLTRMLGGIGMGYYSSALAVFTPIMAIIVSGIPSTIARLVSENYAFERFKNIRKIKLTALITFVLLSVITCVLFVVSSSLCADYIIGEDKSRFALIAISPSVIAAALLSVERGYFEGLKNMIPTAVSEIIETISKLILSLGLAYGVTVYAQKEFRATGKCFGIVCLSYEQAIETALPYITAAAVLGVSLSTCIACIYIILSGKIHGDGISKAMLCRDRHTDKFKATAKDLMVSAFPIALASVIATLSNMIDLMTINASIRKVMYTNSSLFSNLSIPKEMIPNFIYGSYSALPLTIFGFVPTITAMFGKSILPSLSESWVKKEKSLIENKLNLMLFITTVIAIPSGFGISALSKEILELLFSGREEEISVSVIPL